MPLFIKKIVVRVDAVSPSRLKSMHKTYGISQFEVFMATPTNSIINAPQIVAHLKNEVINAPPKPRSPNDGKMSAPMRQPQVIQETANPRAEFTGQSSDVRDETPRKKQVNTPMPVLKTGGDSEAQELINNFMIGMGTEKIGGDAGGGAKIRNV